MEIGVSMFADLPVDAATGKHKSAQERLYELIAEVKLADEVGLDVFGIGEHHRVDYAVSSPEIILAAAATVTKNIKLSSAVTVLSSSDPVKVYQNFATVDLLSNGRTELMVGRGSFIESFPLFGYDLADYDRLFSEKLDLLLEINKNEVANWSGSVRAPLRNQKVLPRAKDNDLSIWIAVGGTPTSVQRAGRLGLPLMVAIIGGYPRQFVPLFDLYRKEYEQHGYDLADYDRLFSEKLDLLLEINKNEVANWSGSVRPPLRNQKVLPRAKDNDLSIWIAVGGTPASVQRAGRLGLPLMVAIIGGYPRQFVPLFDLYRREYEQHGHDNRKFQVGIHSHTLIGEDSRAIADQYFPYYAAQMDRIGRDRGWPPFSRQQFEMGRSREGALFVGSPAEVVDKILYQHEMFGLTRFVAHMDVGGPSHASIMKAIELLGTKVAPEVRKAVKTTA